MRRTLRRMNASVVAAYRRGGLAEIARHVRSDEAMEPITAMYSTLYGQVIPDQASSVYRGLWRSRKVRTEPMSAQEQAQAWALAITALLASLHQGGTAMGAIARNMLQETEKQASDIVAAALEEEVLADEVAGILQRNLEKATPARARLIARTELQRIHNTGRHVGADQYQTDTGVRLVKVWRWSQVSRESHAAIDGQRRALGETFDVGGYAAAYPLDPALPASETINCTCFIDYEEA